MLIDDRSDPPLRAHIGRLLATHAYAEIAVGSIRLSALDLTAPETQHVKRWRVLLGRLEAHSIMPADVAAHEEDARLHALLHLLESGRAEIRSAGLAAWTPDLSIYRDSTSDAAGACLIGAHYFSEPLIADGPSFTILLTDSASVARALARFETLWERSHDVLEPVLTAIRRRQSFSAA